ncbi:hypothetical protein U1Q18_007086 [Sarracenia purpurea var. burkii]
MLRKQQDIYATKEISETHTGNHWTNDYPFVYNGKDKSRFHDIRDSADVVAKIGDVMDYGFQRVLTQSDGVISGGIRVSNWPKQKDEDDLTRGYHLTRTNLYPHTTSQSYNHNPNFQTLPTIRTDPLQSQSDTHPQPLIQAQSQKLPQPKNICHGENQPQPKFQANFENHPQPIIKTPWPNNKCSQTPQHLDCSSDPA